MKQLIIVAVVIMLLIIGGGLTAQIASSGGNFSIPGAIKQTNDPDGSVFELSPWKAEQLFLFVGFILFNLIGIGVTLAIVFWLLHRAVKTVRADEPPKATADQT